MPTDNSPGRRREDYVKDLCDRTHLDLDRRVSKLEQSFEEDLKRLYDKLESETLLWAQKAIDNAKRPSQAMLITISFFSSATVGLMVLVLTYLLRGK